jgi:hypothetical protein
MPCCSWPQDFGWSRAAASCRSRSSRPAATRGAAAYLTTAGWVARPRCRRAAGGKAGDRLPALTLGAFPPGPTSGPLAGHGRGFAHAIADYQDGPFTTRKDCQPCCSSAPSA